MNTPDALALAIVRELFPETEHITDEVLRRDSLTYATIIRVFTASGVTFAGPEGA